jgi:hypothetical protein
MVCWKKEVCEEALRIFESGARERDTLVPLPDWEMNTHLKIQV